jgi:hypothetical protein
LTPVNKTISRLLTEQGRKQSWVVQKMNEANPVLNMDETKFSAIMTERRKMSGDELVAFCVALCVSPDEFMKTEGEE